MKRYWASWWSGNYEDEGCTHTPFNYFISGWRDRINDDRNDQSICALFEAESADDVQAIATKYFPDFEYRFINEESDDWEPGDRFPNAVAYRIERALIARIA